MAFIATGEALARGLVAAQSEARAIKNFAQTANIALAAGAVSANQIIQITSMFKSAKDTFTRVKSLSGIAQYAKNQFDDPAYDVVAEFLAMENSLDICTQWVFDNFPTNSGYILKDQLATDGSIVVRTFTPAQTTGLRTAIDSLIASID